jgi:hypothetical protein
MAPILATSTLWHAIATLAVATPLRTPRPIAAACLQAVRAVVMNDPYTNPSSINQSRVEDS